MGRIHNSRKRTNWMHPALQPIANVSRSRVPMGYPDLFVSAKTVAAIPTRSPVRLDVLIQASLDPQVSLIDYVLGTTDASRTIIRDGIILQRDDGQFLLDFVPARLQSNSASDGCFQIASGKQPVKRLIISLEELTQEPRCSNARLVWSYRCRSVSIEMRMRILQTLLDDGPVQLGELLKSIRSHHDPAPAVMALACADLIFLDLKSYPLGPSTLVGYRGRGSD
jgi:hypothetical protein